MDWTGVDEIGVIIGSGENPLLPKLERCDLGQLGRLNKNGTVSSCDYSA